MRLQTDPTVIYGMGAAYTGNIRRSDLTTDTPYNTYTRRPAADADRDAGRSRAAGGDQPARAMRCISSRSAMAATATCSARRWTRTTRRCAPMCSATARNSAGGAEVSGGLRQESRLLTIEGGEGAGKAPCCAHCRTRSWPTGSRWCRPASQRHPAGRTDPRSAAGSLARAGGAGDRIAADVRRAPSTCANWIAAGARPRRVGGQRPLHDSAMPTRAMRAPRPGLHRRTQRRVVGIEPGSPCCSTSASPTGANAPRPRDLAGGAGPDRIERERDDFFERVRAGFSPARGRIRIASR